jgi:hypothetical protein
VRAKNKFSQSLASPIQYFIHFTRFLERARPKQVSAAALMLEIVLSEFEIFPQKHKKDYFISSWKNILS